MNTKNNKRRQQTRETIETLLMELLQTKELSAVTVSELCKGADVNRSTFYANYADVYDLADALRRRLEKAVESLYENDGTNRYATANFLRLFRHIRENQLFYKTYFKLGYDQSDPVDLCKIHDVERFVPDGHVLYHVEFFRAGFNAMVKRWLRNGCQESPEELAQILQSEYRERPLF